MLSAAQQFLSHASEFQLGDLPTEARHARTGELSQLAKNDLHAALRLLHEVELAALQALPARATELAALEQEMRATLASGGRLFFCGCGATGRLSLSLETLWREETARLARPELAESVQSFMAGGDYALIRSIEKFEDHPEYGASQLRDAGFRDNDLLVASTEGGETPFVIGAAEEATRISKRAPFFMFCNPSDFLAKTVERSRRVLENRRIRSISFETGPMALAGSTRLQASSALMLAAGAALFAQLDGVPASKRINGYLNSLSRTDFTPLAPLIESEAAIYAAGELCVHRTHAYGITVLTDTTERSPTFSLLPFESEREPNTRPSWTYLCVPETSSSLEAWQAVLHRVPRPLAWKGFTEKYGTESLLGFDLSAKTESRRESLSPRLHRCEIARETTAIRFSIDELSCEVVRPSGLLEEHLVLKCALNFASTLVMGRIGRYSSNLMLYVRATNNKLVDRSIRYVKALLEDDGFGDVAYATVCEALFEIMPHLAPDEPIVMLTFEALRNKLERIA